MKTTLYSVFFATFCLSFAHATSVVVRPEGEEKEVMVTFEWKDLVSVTITGGRLSKPDTLTISNGTYVGNERLHEKSSKYMFELAALAIYDYSLSSLRQMLIFKYMVQEQILPQYVRLLPDGVTYTSDGRFEINLTKHFVSMSFYKPDQGELLGVATLDKDSHQITWALAK